jgi:hypothetical protein
MNCRPDRGCLPFTGAGDNAILFAWYGDEKKKGVDPRFSSGRVLCAFLFFLWHWRDIPGKALTVFSEKADVVVRDFRLSQVDGSGIRWTVTATRRDT